MGTGAISTGAIGRSGVLVDVMFGEHREGVLRVGQDGHRYHA
jgi:hypothetical protein